MYLYHTSFIFILWHRSGVPGGLVVMTLTQTVRDWGSIPHLGTEFFRIESLIRPNVTQQNAEIQRKLLLLSVNSFYRIFQQ